MISARLKYYYDLTRYNFGFSVIIGFLIGLNAGIITFGTFGMLVGFLSYKYFQNNQYYFYYNLGISKMALISVTWIINLTISAFFLLLLR
jgi:hypothetical protein